jgi:hypothetical protein
MCASAEVRVKAVERNVETLDFSNAEAAKGATRYLCSAKRRCIVYVVMFCASRDRESWQGVASLGLLRLCFAKLLASLVGQPDAFGAGESVEAANTYTQYMRYVQMSALCRILA